MTRGGRQTSLWSSKCSKPCLIWSNLLSISKGQWGGRWDPGDKRTKSIGLNLNTCTEGELNTQGNRVTAATGHVSLNRNTESTSSTCKHQAGRGHKMVQLTQGTLPGDHPRTWRVRSLFFVQGCQTQPMLRIWELKGHYRSSFLRRELLGTPIGKLMLSKSYH